MTRILKINLALLTVIILTGCSRKLEEENQSLTKEVNSLSITNAILNSLNVRLQTDIVLLQSNVLSASLLGEEMKHQLEVERTLYKTSLAELEKQHAIVILEMKEQSAKLATEGKQRDSDAKNQRILDLKNNLSNALTIANDVSRGAPKAALDSSIAANLVGLPDSTRLKAELVTEHKNKAEDWRKKYEVSKVNVWDLTKATVDRPDVRQLCDSIRAFYKNILDDYHSLEKTSLSETLNALSAPRKASLNDLKLLTAAVLRLQVD
jgi:hypothetical protein